MLNYFKTTDASLVKWSHGVNSKQKLIDSLESDSKILEADILKVDEKHDEPIMAHPPQTESDLKFSEFLHSSKSSKKGLKLDFKTQNAIEPCLEMIKSIKHEISVPIILNADIFQGVNSPAIKITPDFLIDKSLEIYPMGVLSLGWTTTNDSKGNYRWCDVYKAFKLLTDKNILNSSTEVTFAVRLLWSINSLNRLIWLQKFTECTYTLWSHITDKISVLDSILLFRKMFHNSMVYYDLQPAEYEHFKKHAYDACVLENVLKTSTDDLIGSYTNSGKFIDLNDWDTVNGIFYKCEFGALMLENSASFVSKSEYKVNGSEESVEFSGEFEIFSLEEKNENLDNEGRVKLSLRSNKDVSESDKAGSISIYILYSTIHRPALVKVYIGGALKKEANLKTYHRLKFHVKDCGEADNVHIKLTSYDVDSNEESVQLEAKSEYFESQSFYAGLTLLHKDCGLGINKFSVLKKTN